LALYRDRTTYLDWSEQHLYGSSRLGIWHYGKAVPAAPAAVLQDSLSIGSTAYELTNHLGNVLSSISDKKIGVSSNSSTVDYYAAEVLSQNDYYPFGMGMPGRKFSNGLLYRYGFNGKENDNEVKGEGNLQDYGMRIYDPRLGRFLSVDPLAAKYPMLTPYCFVANNAIIYIDPDGRDIKPSKAFLNSLYGAIYQNLYKNNSAYLKIVNNYNTSKVFNLALNFGDKGVPAGFNAWTTTNWKAYSSSPKTPISAESNQAYAITPLTSVVTSGDNTYTYERSEIGKARTIIHEGSHSYLGAKGIKEGGDHSTFNAYRSMMVDALKEYNTDNKLGYTDDQLNELSYGGTRGSKQFKSYIQGLADKNGTSYDDELKGFDRRISEMEWKLVKTEKKTSIDSTKTD
jgi:RHS repeat-associated protein